MTPLHSAAEEGFVEVVKMLIDLKADINAVTVVSKADKVSIIL